MLNVFGVFLINLRLFPMHQLSKEQQEENINLAKLSKDWNGNFLANLSVNRVTSHLLKDSFDSNISEAFEIYNLLQKLAEGLPEQASKLTHKSAFTPD